MPPFRNERRAARWLADREDASLVLVGIMRMEAKLDVIAALLSEEDEDGEEGD